MFIRGGYMISLIVVGVFILFDFVTGLMKAIKNKEINSTVLRKGLFHKLSEIVTVLGAWLLEYGMKYINLDIDIPLLTGVVSYICLMELISIIENLCDLNPDLFKFFRPYLEKMKPKQDDDKGE